MPYIEDGNGNHKLDENGNKMSYIVSYDTDYIHREKLHIDKDGYINTENRHIVIKDGINQDHAVSKGQLDSTKTAIIKMIPSSDPIDPAIAENAMKELIETMIQKSLKKFNKQIKGRVGKKSLTIHKTNYTWIKLLDVTEIDEITSLDEVLIQDMYIKSTDRYHNAKSSQYS